MAATVETVKEKRPAIALSCKRKVVQAVLKTTGLAIYLRFMEDIKTMTQINLYAPEPREFTKDDGRGGERLSTHTDPS